MSLSKEELHRLIDEIPEQESSTVKRLLEFVLAESSSGSGREITAGEAAKMLGVRARQLRQWLREGRLPARKEGSRWLIREKDLAACFDPRANAFLNAPISREQLTDEEKQGSDRGWQDYLNGKALTLRDAARRRAGN
jgi:excisionase family DNA binding protein